MAIKTAFEDFSFSDIRKSNYKPKIKTKIISFTVSSAHAKLLKAKFFNSETEAYKFLLIFFLEHIARNGLDIITFSNIRRVQTPKSKTFKLRDNLLIVVEKIIADINESPACMYEKFTKADFFRLVFTILDENVFLKTLFEVKKDEY